VDRMAVTSMYASCASPDAVEEALRRVLADKSPDLLAVSRLVARLQVVRPSEALFPGVRALLASGNPALVSAGVGTAKALGREELLPDLAGLLDSMDPNVRNSAKEAIDAIVALRKLKDEARRGAK
jgi:HEAT repeat protein